MAFWKTLGGVPVQNGQLKMISFPGTLILVRKADSVAPTVGSNINHVGFFVKDLAAAKAKWGAADSTYRYRTPLLLTSSSLVLTAFALKSTRTRRWIPHCDTPHPFFSVDPEATRAWYVKWFGATPGTRGTSITAQVPGMELAFASSKDAVAPTKGRALDHIGFEVKNLP